MFAEKVEAARAFATSREEHETSVKQKRQELAESWGKFSDLGPGKGGAGGASPYSPYAFLHRDHRPKYPPQADRDAAIAKLPYLASDRFIKQVKDSRKAAVFTYVRRPTYYATFNSGPQITKQQRLGLGLVWSPRAGALLQSQTDSADHAWGTRADGAGQVYESGDVNATFSDDLTTVTYPLGSAGKKTVTFAETIIQVRVEHPGKFVEQVPLLRAGDAPVKVMVSSDVAGTPKPGSNVFGTTKVTTTNLAAQDLLDYTIRIAP
jgi:hypothetical protein